MFDPTIFDNLKVVIEGAVYDCDLEGQWLVNDRKDIVDLATMSRQYSISFHVIPYSEVSCRWFLSSTSIQLTSELSGREKELHGCSTWLEFTMETTKVEDIVETCYEKVAHIWEKREISCSIINSYPLNSKATLKIVVKFDRTIREEDINDLLEMPHFMEKTLYALQVIID